jgi:hypothetical protein
MTSNSFYTFHPDVNAEAVISVGTSHKFRK